MKNLQNFHVPLPKEVYQDLRLEAEQSNRPATTLAREAIEKWLQERKRLARRQAITEYAKEVAGTNDDLDPDLEASSLELWEDLKP
jgi:predicted DNA-binding protein